MLVLMIGGSASGKSEYGEKRAVAAAREDGSRLIYLATMMPFGEEARMRIERHRKLRAGKGFETVERYTDIEGLCTGSSEEARQFQKQVQGAAVMLECISNLVANEIFVGANSADYKNRLCSDHAESIIEKVYRRIIKGIEVLNALAGNLIVVSIDVFGDGHTYDDETEAYRKCLGAVNCALASMADEVVEVVYGIPVQH